MNLFIYSDESGVFDRVHNDIFVFGGLICLFKKEKDICERKYRTAESVIRKKKNYAENVELKASILDNTDKGKLYRSLNGYYKFGAVVHQKKIQGEIFNDKKSKQRYLDYVYKIGVKRALESLVNSGKIIPNDIENMYFCVDEHTTATNGHYELREGLEQELKYGTFNYHYSCFYPPLFPKMGLVELKYCNSSEKTLIRAADIVANNIYHQYISGVKKNQTNLCVTEYP